MTDTKAILEKVRKLRRLAQSSNVNEAAAAAAQADALVQKYRLDEAELGEESEDIGEALEPLDVQPGAPVDWRTHLAVVVAAHYGCTVYARRGRKKGTRVPVTRIKVIGVPSDVEVVRYMFAWITAEIGRLMLAEPFDPNDFALGAVKGITEALAKAKREAEGQHAAKHGTSAAMVLVRREEAAEAWMREKCKMAPTSFEEPEDIGAFSRGLAAGSRIDVQRRRALGKGAR